MRMDWMVILLPGSVLTGLTPQQLEAVLAHELAHIRRHDYLLNLLQTVYKRYGHQQASVEIFQAAAEVLAK